MTQTTTYKVLIVEDTADNLEAFRDLLKLPDYEVFEARNADEALFFFRKNSPDIVLMDIKLSEKENSLNGIDVAETMIQQRTCPIIFLTGFAGSYIDEARKRIDYSRFLTKPYDPDMLMIQIEDSLRKFYAEKVPSFYIFRCDKGVFHVKTNELVCVESKSSSPNATVHLYRNGKAESYQVGYKITETVGLFFEKHPTLEQVHKQYYVNLFWIDKYLRKEDRLYLQEPFQKQLVFVGDSHKEKLLKWIKEKK